MSTTFGILVIAIACLVVGIITGRRAAIQEHNRSVLQAKSKRALDTISKLNTDIDNGEVSVDDVTKYRIRESIGILDDIVEFYK